jgi:hypothetical protein
MAARRPVISKALMDQVAVEKAKVEAGRVQAANEEDPIMGTPPLSQATFTPAEAPVDAPLESFAKTSAPAETPAEPAPAPKVHRSVRKTKEIDWATQPTVEPPAPKDDTPLHERIDSILAYSETPTLIDFMGPEGSRCYHLVSAGGPSLEEAWRVYRAERPAGTAKEFIALCGALAGDHGLTFRTVSRLSL